MMRPGPYRPLAACLAGCLAALVPLPAQQVPLPAQQRALTASDFLIPDSQNLIVIDLAATRRLGVWEDLEASVLNVVFARIEKEMGFPLDALDRMQVSMFLPEVVHAPTDGQKVIVWQGNRELTLEASTIGERWEDERIGEFTARRRAMGAGEELFVKVRPDLVVLGTADQVRPVLERQRKQTPQAPDLQSLLSGREGRLAWVVYDLGHEMMRQRFLAEVLGADLTAWPEGDRPTHLSAQLLVTGDAGDPHVEVRAVLRHVREGEGAAVSLSAADALVQRLCADDRLRLIRPLLKQAKATQDHTDVVLQVDFGRSRDAVGNLAVLLLPMIGRGAEVDARAPKPTAEAPAGGK